MNTKQCKTCKKVKLLEAFRKSSTHAEGRRAHCKQCERVGSGKFNDEAELDWRDEDLEVKNRAKSWARHHGRTAMVKAGMRLP